MDAKTLFHHWSNVRQGLVQAIDQLSVEQLDFRPREGLWSLRETVCHIAGTENSWFRCYVTHEFNSWEEADFHPEDYPTPQALKALLADVHRHIVALYAEEGDKKLAQLATMPWGPQVSQEWVVWHVLEHEIHHRGEVYLMLGLLGMEAPDV